MDAPCSVLHKQNGGKWTDPGDIISMEKVDNN